MNQNLLVIYESNLGIRISGFIVIVAGLSLATANFLADLPAYLGYKDEFSRFLCWVLVFASGIFVILFGGMLTTVRDRKMVFDSLKQKVYYSDRNFFKRNHQEFFFHQISNITQVQQAFENYETYENFLNLANAASVRIPSNHNRSRELQLEQIEEIKTFIGMHTT